MIKLSFINLLLMFILVKSYLFSIEPPKTLIIKDLKESEINLKVESYDNLSLHYDGWLFDKNVKTGNYCDAKGKKFDSTREKPFRATPTLFKFKIGKGLVIPGWELGLLRMKKGGLRCLVIPHQLAYGHREINSKGKEDTLIPAYSTLIFEVNLIEIDKNKN